MLRGVVADAEQSRSRLSRVQRDVESVRSQMAENLDKVLSRGEKLDSLMEQSESLASMSKQFEACSRRLDRPKPVSMAKCSAPPSTGAAAANRRSAQSGPRGGRVGEGATEEQRAKMLEALRDEVEAPRALRPGIDYPSSSAISAGCMRLTDTRSDDGIRRNNEWAGHGGTYTTTGVRSASHSAMGDVVLAAVCDEVDARTLQLIGQVSYEYSDSSRKPIPGGHRSLEEQMEEEQDDEGQHWKITGLPLLVSDLELSQLNCLSWWRIVRSSGTAFCTGTAYVELNKETENTELLGVRLLAACLQRGWTLWKEDNELFQWTDASKEVAERSAQALIEILSIDVSQMDDTLGKDAMQGQIVAAIYSRWLDGDAWATALSEDLDLFTAFPKGSWRQLALQRAMQFGGCGCRALAELAYALLVIVAEHYEVGDDGTTARLAESVVPTSPLVPEVRRWLSLCSSRMIDWRHGVRQFVAGFTAGPSSGPSDDGDEAANNRNRSSCEWPKVAFPFEVVEIPSARNYYE